MASDPDQKLTSSALLRGLFEADNDAVWSEFYDRYPPIIVAVARRLGLGPEDAADVAQETLIKFFQEYRSGKYDRDKGRLRSWILSIARYRIADVMRARARNREWRGESAIAVTPDEDRIETLWDEECRRVTLNQAMNELRESTRLDEQTIKAFQRLALDQRTPADVADEFGMSIDSVYKAKQRCLAQLKTILARLGEA